MTNKKFKLAAMSLATAVAVSTVGPSASAVTYQLEKGECDCWSRMWITGAYSYQGEDGSEEHRTYVNEDKADNWRWYDQDTSRTATRQRKKSLITPTIAQKVPTPTDNDTRSTDASGNNTENSSTSETTTTNTITVKEDVTGATIVVDGVNVDTSDTSTQTEVSAG